MLLVDADKTAIWPSETTKKQSPWWAFSSSIDGGCCECLESNWHKHISNCFAGVYLNIKAAFPDNRIPNLKIRWPVDHLTFAVAFHKLERQQFYSEMTTWWSYNQT